MIPLNSTHDDSTPSKTKRLAYSLAAAAAAGAATEADAAIVYSGAQDISIGLGASQPLNLDGDAYTDILLKNYSNAFGLGGIYQGASVLYLPGKVVGFVSGVAYGSALDEGDLIDASTTYGGPAFFSMAYGTINPSAEFNNADGAFLGLEFPINATSHFGWIRVTIDNAAGTFVINDWAYNDVPGVGINAGAIPEPSTLGLLAAGAAGVASMRRRRESQS